FVVLVALAAKNAILIVEYAQDQRRKEGMSRRQATLTACQLRLRPIIMTSLAFIFGVYPLLVATGAGWEMRRSLGTAAFSGMIGVTLFGIFLTPVFYYLITWFEKEKKVQVPEEHLPSRDGERQTPAEPVLAIPASPGPATS